MKACVVFCTIRHTESFGCYAKNFKKFGHTPDVLIVDETGETRKFIGNEFKGWKVEFYGAKERAEWFKAKNIDPNTVPAKTTDVIGFSLLVAYPRKYDMIVFVDDDTYPLPDHDFLTEHYDVLYNQKMQKVYSANNWVNPHPRCYGRGYPYALRKENAMRTTKKGSAKGSVLNMGLWHNVPDLNAVDYLYLGSLTGQYNDKGAFSSENFVLGSSYLPLSRMNISFNPKIIPAFYQLSGNEYGMGRYGDVFSGLFIMKIAKHLGEYVSFGSPFCIHNKEPRDVFRDIKSEVEAIKLNETMYQVLDKIEVSGDSYASCYLSIADGLLKYKTDFHTPEYISFLVERMRGWVKAVQA